MLAGKGREGEWEKTTWDKMDFLMLGMRISSVKGELSFKVLIVRTSRCFITAQMDIWKEIFTNVSETLNKQLMAAKETKAPTFIFHYFDLFYFIVFRFFFLHFATSTQLSNRSSPVCEVSRAIAQIFQQENDFFSSSPDSEERREIRWRGKIQSHREAGNGRRVWWGGKWAGWHMRTHS